MRNIPFWSAELWLCVQVRSLETNVRQLECEAERNADSIREYMQQIDTLQVRQGSTEGLPVPASPYMASLVKGQKVMPIMCIITLITCLPPMGSRAVWPTKRISEYLLGLSWATSLQSQQVF